jgi:hypothetical protein
VAEAMGVVDTAWSLGTGGHAISQQYHCRSRREGGDTTLRPTSARLPAHAASQHKGGRPVYFVVPSSYLLAVVGASE